MVEVENTQNESKTTIQVPPLFPQRLKRKEDGDNFKKFMGKLSNLLINIPLLEVIQEIQGYAMQMKTLMSKKNLIEDDNIEVTHSCSTIVDNKIAEKKDSPRAFTIPCTIGLHMFEKSPCYLGARIKIMSFVN